MCTLLSEAVCDVFIRGLTCVLVIRYISEDFGGVALHPIDLLDASTGRQVAQLTDPNLETICPVNKPHPRQDIIISGSSRSLYAWKPTPQGVFNSISRVVNICLCSSFSATSCA